MYCLVLEGYSGKTAVVSEVSSLPEAKQWPQFVKPGLVELLGREGVGDVQLDPKESLGQGDPHLLLRGQLVEVVTGEGCGVEGGGVQLAKDQEVDFLRKVQQHHHLLCITGSPKFLYFQVVDTAYV